ncbi:hypothetical protein T265_04874 [Opisthorchis viverrini]|uniref:Sodium/calcium exchanger membrane region domain-containing protein n=2 Tax=Opisthorchis viverrini TaxID=6198 RepID=A0A074ZMG8_OPIVI|nr:hypothetical protein T265_04874 [Opisthorchis viverrini]KER28276.1 hypothetical protein T265_04874 [Opisthorchis viverrini]
MRPCGLHPYLIALCHQGVTLLAFGNGAPDVFSAVTAITTGDPDAPDEGLGLGFLLGSGLLVNTVTAGLVIASTPFKMSRRPFLKDIFFYLSAVSWSALILIRRRLYYADAIGFLVFYCCYVLVTWAGGTIHRRQKEAEKRYGSGTFWPTPIQRLLDGVNRTWVKIKQPLAVCFNRACPMYTRFRKELCKLKRKPEKGETPGTQSDVGSQAVEKSAAAGQPFVMNGSLANGGVGEQGKNTISQRTYPTLKKPTIEVTSHEDPDYQLDAPGSPYTPSADITADQSRASPMQPAENMIPMNLIQPGEHHRKRASSVGTSNENCNPRRLSTSTPGPGVLTRDRCGRSYSVNRRRASARMSTVGYELPYLVRWIIGKYCSLLKPF